MLIEDQIKSWLGKLFPTPLVGIRRFMRLAGAGMIVSTLLPIVVGPIAYAEYTVPLSGEVIVANAPISVDMLLAFIQGELVGPFATAAAAGSAKSGVAGFIVDAFLAPPLLVASVVASILLLIIPFVVGGLLLLGYDKYFRLLGFSYLVTVGFYQMGLASNSVTVTAGLGMTLTTIISLSVGIAGIDRAKDWGLIEMNQAGGYQAQTAALRGQSSTDSSTTTEQEYAGTATELDQDQD